MAAQSKTFLGRRHGDESTFYSRASFGLPINGIVFAVLENAHDKLTQVALTNKTLLVIVWPG